MGHEIATALARLAMTDSCFNINAKCFRGLLVFDSRQPTDMVLRRDGSLEEQACEFIRFPGAPAGEYRR